MKGNLTAAGTRTVAHKRKIFVLYEGTLLEKTCFCSFF